MSLRNVRTRRYPVNIQPPARTGPLTGSAAQVYCPTVSVGPVKPGPPAAT